MIIITLRPSEQIHVWKGTELANYEATCMGQMTHLRKGSCHHGRLIHIHSAT